MLHIYTDGACKGNPGPGGYGMVILNGNELFYLHGELFEEDVTNNQMELRAIIYALEFMQEIYPEEVFTIHSDSRYCVSICNEWIWNWARNGWQNSKKQQIENYDLVKKLYKYLNVDFPNFKIEKCAGHAGIAGNELADAVATNNSKKFAEILKRYNIEHHLIIDDLIS